ncbi:MAG: IS110 family transposase [Gemmatimonadales bacterium]
MSKVTIGMDLGDQYSHICVVDATGATMHTARVRTTPAGLTRWFGAQAPGPVVIEAGTHSPWVSRHLTALGHTVLVANPRRLRLIYASDRKDDRVDAEYLARVGRLDPQLLGAITHRGAETQAALAVLRSRDALVRTRTQLINHVRGVVKAVGGRLPACSTEAFVRRATPHIPAALAEAVAPLLHQLTSLAHELRTYDAALARLSTETYPETARLRQVVGVGPVTALAYVLILEDPRRFRRSRAVGAYLGLQPRRRQSGARDPQLRISKAGDPLLRRLLVQAAQYLLGPFGPDCDLRRHGMRIAAAGGGHAKKRAVIAVARKLAVLLHRLWCSGATYDPQYHLPRAA